MFLVLNFIDFNINNIIFMNLMSKILNFIDFNIDDIIFTNLKFLVLKSLLKYFTLAIKIQIYIEFNNFYRNFKFLQFQIMNPIKIYRIIIIIYKINLNQFFTIYLLS